MALSPEGRGGRAGWFPTARRQQGVRAHLVERRLVRAGDALAERAALGAMIGAGVAGVQGPLTPALSPKGERVVLHGSLETTVSCSQLWSSRLG